PVERRQAARDEGHGEGDRRHARDVEHGERGHARERDDDPGRLWVSALAAAGGRSPDDSREERGRAGARGRHPETAAREKAGRRARVDGEDGRTTARRTDWWYDSDGAWRREPH